MWCPGEWEWLRAVGMAGGKAGPPVFLPNTALACLQRGSAGPSLFPRLQTGVAHFAGPRRRSESAGEPRARRGEAWSLLPFSPLLVAMLPSGSRPCSQGRQRPCAPAGTLPPALLLLLLLLWPYRAQPAAPRRGHLVLQAPAGASRCPGTHHLPHAVLALHLGPQLHKALLHALVEGPQVLRHLPLVDPDPLCQQRGLQEKRARVWLGLWGSPGQGCWGGATGSTCQAIRSFSLSMFPWSSGCSFRYDSWKKACSEPRSVLLVAGTGTGWC